MSWKDFKHKIAVFLESPQMQLAIVALVLIDLALIVTDLILAQQFCGQDPPEDAVRFREFSEIASFTITCLFTVETLVHLLVAFKRYIRSKLHVADMIVIFISFSLELGFRNTNYQEVTSVFVLFRLWRLVRIVHASAELTEIGIHNKIQRYKEHVKELEELLGKHQAESFSADASPRMFVT
jgi:uncharacterized membrane protein